MFFRNERGGSHTRGDDPYFLDSVLDNIGIPLGVSGGQGERTTTEGDEEVHRPDLVHDQIALSTLHHEQFGRPLPQLNISNFDESERIAVEMGGEGEGIP